MSDDKSISSEDFDLSDVGLEVSKEFLSGVTIINDTDRRIMTEFLSDIVVGKSPNPNSLNRFLVMMRKIAEDNVRLRKYKRNAKTAIKSLQRAYDEKSRLLDKRGTVLIEEVPSGLTVSVEDLNTVLPQVEGRYS